MPKNPSNRRKKIDYAILPTLPLAARLEIVRLMRLREAQSILELDKKKIEARKKIFIKEKNVKHRTRLATELRQRQSEILQKKKEIESLKRQSLKHSPLSNRILPTQLDDRLASLSRREERITRFETKIRSDIIVMSSNRTPCKIIGTIRKHEMASVEESLLALARAHENAMPNGHGHTEVSFELPKLLLGNQARKQTEEGIVRGWTGHITSVANQGANCALVVAEMLIMFARNPDLKDKIVTDFRTQNNVRIAGSITLSRRIVYRKIVGPKHVVERYEVPDFYRSRTFNLGVPIKRKR